MTASSSDAPTDGDTSGLRQWLSRLVSAAFTPPEEADDRYARVQTLKERVTVERHGLGARISHWMQALLMFVLAATGFAIWTGTYGPLNVAPWGGYYLAFGTHMWAGILLLAFLFVLFPMYHVLVDGHAQLASLADVREALRVSQAFVGLKSYIPGYHEARRAYDAEEDEWVAYHPMQKTFFWSIVILFGVLVLTGFGMYAEMRADPVWWIGILGFLESYVGFVLLKQIHLLCFFLVVAAVFGHLYMTLLPSNHDTLRSMILGEMDAYVLEDEDDDER